MNRTGLIQACLRSIDARSYLEIGVSKGLTFKEVVCEKKVAVDPRFRFDWKGYGHENPNSTLLEIGSDEFFFDQASSEERFDVIFLDGLHTSDQTLRDFINATRFLSRGGLIVIDDVTPDSYYSSLRLQADANDIKAKLGFKDRGWMGDVYRIVPFIQTFCQQYSHARPAEVPNCLVVWEQARPSAAIAGRQIAEVGLVPYEETVLSADFYNTLPIERILIEAQARRGGTVPALEPQRPLDGSTSSVPADLPVRHGT